MEITKRDIENALQVAKIVAEAIKAAESIPSGHLYAIMLSADGWSGMNSQTYERVIALLCRSGLVKQENYLLTWIGPK